jgi:RNA polymerase sigma-54 factor
MNAPVIRLEHRQHQTLTPRLQQAVRLLQLSSLDFAQEVQQAVGNNPFLEEDPESHAAPVAAAENAPADTPPTWAEVTPVTAPAADMPWDRESWGSPGSGGSGRGGSGDGELDLVEMVAADVSLRQTLHSQINVMPLSPRDRQLAGTIIEALDDDGYLRLGLDELMGLSGCSPLPDDTEMNVAIKLVQSLDPAGIAARDVRECLLLQLKDLEQLPECELASRIVSDHLDRLAMRDVNGLARTLGASVAQVEAVCERIRHLDPRPGWRFGPSNTQFVTPDVIVRKVRGVWTAALNPDVIPKVRLNQVYAELFQRHRDSGHAELAAHLQEARWTVRNVEQRFATILHVAQAIVKRQRHFLEYGALAMKPLGLREIAEELGLHESTVSRVTNNKYMATPLGVFELKYFFSRALPTVSGGSCSATAIRGVIKDMIEAEDASDPLSDAQIARQLARQGLSVARRTVTKYRQMMKLPSVEKRRKHV